MRVPWLVNQLWFNVPIALEEFVNTRLRLEIYDFFSCSYKIPRGLSAFSIYHTSE